MWWKDYKIKFPEIWPIGLKKLGSFSPNFLWGTTQKRTASRYNKKLEEYTPYMLFKFRTTPAMLNAECWLWWVSWLDMNESFTFKKSQAPKLLWGPNIFPYPNFFLLYYLMYHVWFNFYPTLSHQSNKHCTFIDYGITKYIYNHIFNLCYFFTKILQ